MPDAENATARGRRLPGARQRRGDPDREALRGATPPTGARRRRRTICAGSCRTPRSSCSTRSPGCTRRARSSLGEGTRLVGSFRAHGLTVPVWDLPSGMSAEDVEKPAAEFAERLAAALASDAPLTAEERRARGGLTNRQVTLS